MKQFYFSSKDYVLKFDKKSILLLVSTGNINGYTNVIWNILQSAQKANSVVNFVLYEEKTSNFAYDFLNLRKSKKLRQQVITRCNEIISTVGGDITLTFFAQKREFNIFAQVIHHRRSQIDDELIRSIHGAWVGRNWKTMSFSVVGPREYLSWFSELEKYNFGNNLVKNFFKEKFYDLVLVPNGRYPAQVGMKRAGVEKKSTVLFYERDNSRTFLQNFQTQDLENLSEYLSEWLKLTTESERALWMAWSREWLIKQRADTRQNPFVWSGQKMKSESKFHGLLMNNSTSLIIPIFTSSVGERFSNLPRHLNGWKSQPDAVLACANKILANGLIPHVRLHPNLQWKSLREMAEIVVPLERAGISYQLPWEGPDSYYLVEQSNTIITWSSTIALEALAIGKCAFNLDISSHQLISGIKTLNSNSLEDVNLTSSYSIDLDNVLLAIYAYKNFGVENWNNSKPNFPSLTEVKSFFGFKKVWTSFTMIFSLIINPWKSNSRNLMRILNFFFGKKFSRKILIVILKSRSASII
jgi:hypothetical protein